MNSLNFSLLYPTVEQRTQHENADYRPNVSEAVCDELGLNEIFGMKSGSLTDLFTSDIEVIKYRQQTVKDLLELPELLETLSGIHPILDDIKELRRLDSDKINAADSYLYSITEVEL